MIIGNNTYDHIEILDETGGLIAVISDNEIVEKENCMVKLCETDEMFKGE